mmetsp:Transcript_8512/g.37552  ORF Transcript_8512/g.37552 Transcript_8512/m.37552 type:complete len:201 (-) Transcript_8512:414-1016(-)
MCRRGKTSRAARARGRAQGSVRRGAGAGARRSPAAGGAAPRGLSGRRGVEGRRRRFGKQRHLPRRVVRRDGGEGGGSFDARRARRHPEAGVSRLRARGRVLGAARGDGTAAELGYVHGVRAPEDPKLAPPHRHRGLAKLPPGERARVIGVRFVRVNYKPSMYRSFPPHIHPVSMLRRRLSCPRPAAWTPARSSCSRPARR